MTSSRRVVPILLYHSVADDPPKGIARFAVSPEAFRRQLEHILERRADALTVSQLAAAMRGDDALPPKPVVITFDDGWADFAARAEPLLAHYALPASLYVTTAFVDRDPEVLDRFGAGPRDAMSWTEVRDCAARGIEIGAHTTTHPQLDVIAPRSAVAEIVDSRHRLECELQGPVRTFAYPHGYSTALLRHTVAGTGFDAACAVKNALSSTEDDVFALARLTVGATTPLATIAAWIDGHGAPVASRHVGVRTHAWRAYRRARRAFDAAYTAATP